MTKTNNKYKYFVVIFEKMSGDERVVPFEFLEEAESAYEYWLERDFSCGFILIEGKIIKDNCGYEND